MSKITALTALSALAEADALPVVDVSDTSSAVSGTTKKVTVSDLKAYMGVIDQPTRTALGTSYTPSQLTMRVVHAERSRNPLPADGPHVPLVEEFLGDNLFTSRYDIFTESGTAASQTIADNKLTATATGGGALNRVYRAATKLAVPSGVFTAVRVEPGWTGTGTSVGCGFYTTSGGDKLEATWNLTTGALAISTTNAGFQFQKTYDIGTADTLPGPTTDTGPLWLGLIFAFTEAILLTSRDGRNWDPQCAIGMQRVDRPDTVPSAWNAFRPGIRLNPAASGSVAVSSFRAGYAGAYGIRDMKPCTFEDGTPLRLGGKYYFTATAAHGGGSFRSNHMAVFSFDPHSYQVDLVRHLYYNLTGTSGVTGIGACYGGQAVYDETTGKWTVLANTWGMDSTDSGVDLVLAETYQDILSPGVSVLRGTRLTELSAASVYDATLRKENGTWLVVGIETDVYTGFTTDHQPALFTGSSLSSLTKITRTTGLSSVDGTCWAKIGGNWYVIAGRPSGFLSWAPDLSGQTTLTSWTTNVPAGLLFTSGFPQHACVFPVDDEWQTRYVVLTFDDSTVMTSNASTGGLVVLEADEKPTGQEFAPRLVPRYIGA